MCGRWLGPQLYNFSRDTVPFENGTVPLGTTTQNVQSVSLIAAVKNLNIANITFRKGPWKYKKNSNKL